MKGGAGLHTQSAIGEETSGEIVALRRRAEGERREEKRV